LPFKLKSWPCSFHESLKVGLAVVAKDNNFNDAVCHAQTSTKLKIKTLVQCLLLARF